MSLRPMVRRGAAMHRPGFRRRLRSGAARAAAVVCTASLLAVGAASAGHAAPRPSPASAPLCAADRHVTIFNINGFQGHIANAARMFTPVAQERSVQGDDNVVLLSAGDNVGGSTFDSASQGDDPSLDVLKAAGLDATALGNHELDQGFSDFSGRIVPYVDGQFLYLGANVRNKGTKTVASPLSASTIIDRGGLRIGVVGAITNDLPSLVSPTRIKDKTVGDPVAAVNAEASRLKRNGADIVVAEYHEGALSTTGGAAAQSGYFSSIYKNTSADVDAVFTGHTHRQYSWRTRTGRPLVQAASYGEGLARLRIGFDSHTHRVCSSDASLLNSPARPDTANPTVRNIQQIAADASQQSRAVGERRIGTASTPITTASDDADRSFGNEVRDGESTLSDMVAQMFRDSLGRNDPKFIGLQNPGGTRASLLHSSISYEDAAQVLPFGDTLMTRRLTGAQFKNLLEQQWQVDDAGPVPRSLYLQLGMSSNVNYTYDESRPRGDRITGIWVDGRSIDPKAPYTVGSSAFLINGADHFTELTRGTAPVDTGRIDLQSWVGWIQSHRALAPSFAKQAVSLTSDRPPAAEVRTAAFTLGAPLAGGSAPDSVDFSSKGAVRNRSVAAYLVQNGRKVQVGSAPVSEGSTTLTISVPAGKGLRNGDAVVQFEFPDSGTVVRSAIRIDVPSGKASPAPSPSTPIPQSTPAATQDLT